jgi:hypothetical protein
VKKYQGVYRLLQLLLLAALLGGCASMESRPANTAEQRAAERLDLLFKGDLAGAYLYFSPGYRSGVSALAWQRSFLNRPVQWESAEVIESECSEDACKVKISVNFAVYGAVPGASRIALQDNILENWILSDGTWYLVP